MPISRDPRTDRRRRVLHNTVEPEPLKPAKPSTRSNRQDPVEPGVRRSAGYSQDVRSACSARLVQLIPVRKRSYMAVVMASLLIPILLLYAHYKIYVSGAWPWFGHPLALSLDAFHPQSIAAWFSSHLWLLCLAATVLTFQLRKHKLDDYNGDYRLWFWLVPACFIASVDSTTHLSEMLGLAINGWSTFNLGWSGPAVVEATLTVLIGMLGLRLIGELKRVPPSLVLWLVGLVAWAAAAALSQEEFKTELSIQYRTWLRCACWLGGLTAIWLAGLSYLRHTYIEAQRRFLLRGRLVASAKSPLGQRIRESMPSMPTLPKFGKQASDEVSIQRVAEAVGSGEVQTSRKWGLPGIGRKSSAIESDIEDETADGNRSQQSATTTSKLSENAPTGNADERQKPSANIGSKPSQPSVQAASKSRTTSTPSEASAENAPSRWNPLRWLPNAKDDDEASEYKKSSKQQPAKAESESRVKPPLSSASGSGSAERSKAATTAKGWWPGLSFLKFTKRSGSKSQQGEATEKNPTQPQPLKKSQSSNPTGAKPVVSTGQSVKQSRDPSSTQDTGAKSWRSRFKLPKFGLSALMLKPPQANAEAPTRTAPPTDKNPASSGATQPAGEDEYEDDDDMSQDRTSQPMSKAERKRLRRLQQQNRAA